MLFNFRYWPKYFLFTISLLPLLVLTCSQLNAGSQSERAPSLFSVTFSIPNTFNGVSGPGPMSGPEPYATAANPLFGAANVWNNLPAPFGVLVTNPSWSGLVDNQGRTTHVGFSVTGTVLPTNLYPYDPSAYVGDTLRSQFISWNSWNGPVFGGAGPGESTTIRWAISGLKPHTRYAMFVYGGLADISRSFDISIEGVTKNVPVYLYGSSIGAGGVYFAHIWSDPWGRISGEGIGVGDDSTAQNEANWVGFQLVEMRVRQ